ncbi:MAG: 7-cyano-7-deazaguanine synthase [Planctomycetes bacterium]|nr:7-cyano-7-deazaguanine synthase [Planctomycetota bacterium]
MTIGRPKSETTGLLLSGGLDSAILLAEFIKQGIRVQPFYIKTGCVWQTEERRSVEQFIDALDSSFIEPVVDLKMPVADLYGKHWSTTGEEVPDESTSDAAVYLWGRNPLLLMKAILWCSMHEISQLALATLDNNPFADATPQFFEPFEQALATATGNSVEIICPLSHLNKQQILALGADLPLELTFSCLAPIEGKHCGECNKCAERRRGLQSLPDGDPTFYAKQQAACAGS